MDSKINVYALKIMILFYIIIFCLLTFILINDFQILWLCFMILLISLGILFFHRPSEPLVILSCFNSFFSESILWFRSHHFFD